MAPAAHITADELARMDGVDDYELVRGELVRMPPTYALRGMLMAAIGARLAEFVDQSRAGVALARAGYIVAHDPDTVLGPDVSYLRASPRGLPWDEFIRGAPQLAVEVVSPENTRQVLAAKAEQYLGAGCELVWIVDPGSQSALAITAGGSREIGRDGALDGGTALPGFTLPLRELFDFDP